MQQGSVIREHRKLEPDVWCYRWWESGPSGNRVHRRIVLGIAEQCEIMASARQMTAGLVQEISASDIRMTGKFMARAQLADHFQQRELGRSNTRLSHSTKRAYQGYLGKWIVPRWGDYLVPNIKAVEVGALRRWQRRTPYQSPESWVFASPQQRGKGPYWGQQLLRHHIRPAAQRVGIVKHIGWHTLRRIYSTLLRATGAKLKVMQELMRHSTIRVTLDTYTQAVTTEKRAAQTAVVSLFLGKKGGKAA